MYYDRYDYYYGRKKRRRLLLLGIVIAIIIAIPFVQNYYSEKTYTATVTDKDVKNYDSSSKFLVFTKLENGETRVFSVEDTLVKGRWNSADDYADIEVDETYTFTVIGWRNPFLSSYENIIEFQKTTK